MITESGWLGIHANSLAPLVVSFFRLDVLIYVQPPPTIRG